MENIDNITSEIVSIDLITPDPNQPREVFHGIEKLAETIASHTLLNPIMIDENYVIILGERRYRAVKLLGWPKIEVKIWKGDLSEFDRYTKQMIENQQQSATGNGADCMTSMNSARAWMKYYKIYTGKRYNLDNLPLYGLSKEFIFLTNLVGAKADTVREYLLLLLEPIYVQRSIEKNEAIGKKGDRTLFREANRAPKEIQERIKRKIVARHYHSTDEITDDVNVARKIPELLEFQLLRNQASEPEELRRLYNGVIRLALAITSATISFPFETMSSEDQFSVNNFCDWLIKGIGRYRGKQLSRLQGSSIRGRYEVQDKDTQVIEAGQASTS